MDKRDLKSAAYNYALRFSVQAGAHKTDRLGTFGPASPVRRIDPKTGEVIEGEVVAAPAPRARKFQRRSHWR
jgi:hypothetical protein